MTPRERYDGGEVDSRRSKRIVEGICDTVYGVTDVHNQLEIVSKPRD